jgi:hypothetical protein
VDEELMLRAMLSQAFGILSRQDVEPKRVLLANEKMLEVIGILNGTIVVEENSQR